jgi:general secretion pathway protein K
MKTSTPSTSRGIALIIVMIAIFVLSILIGAFAYSMKVETRLAMNSNHEEALIWLGRSGVERARWILAQSPPPGEPYDSLNQKWAGGPGGMNSSNSPLADISLEDYQIGDGIIRKITIVDLEQKFNINLADEAVLQQALTLVGVDAGEIPAISSAILDWIDPDENTHLNGAESDYYQTLDPPYYAKNKPIDDLLELLQVRGITPDMYWGSASTNHTPAGARHVDRHGRLTEQPSYPVGLEEIFTPLSSGKININTASATTLQTIPLIDANAAAEIVKLRAGPDGADGTDDDTPFHNIGEVAMAVNPQLMQQLTRYGDVHSRTFKVQVDVEISGYKRTFYAVLGRNSPRDVQVLSFYWD